MPKSTASDSRCLRQKIAAMVIIGLLLVAVCAPGVAVLLDPVGPEAPPWCVVTSLDDIPLNGEPKEFHVVRSASNAWEGAPAQLVGCVFLRRAPNSNEVIALAAAGPGMGCPTIYDDKHHCFRCPCHHEVYDVDGRRVGSNPAPRDLDTLDVAVQDGEVSVKWQQFRTGIADKIPRK